MTRIQFLVPGDPQSKGSSRALPAPWVMQAFRSGRPIILKTTKHLAQAFFITSDNSDLKVWQATIQKAAWAAIQSLPREDRALMDGPVRLGADFYLKRAKALKYDPPHLQKPDLDKLLRAVKDALTGKVWTDDAIVTEITASKRFVRVGQFPGVLITAQAIPPALFGG